MGRLHRHQWLNYLYSDHDHPKIAPRTPGAAKAQYAQLKFQLKKVRRVVMISPCPSCMVMGLWPRQQALHAVMGGKVEDALIHDIRPSAAAGLH
jgi:hypothetical protein